MFFFFLWFCGVTVSFMSTTIVQFVNLWITIAIATQQEKHYTNGIEDYCWGGIE